MNLVVLGSSITVCISLKKEFDMEKIIVWINNWKD
jgi:hypothetical protein